MARVTHCTRVWGSPGRYIQGAGEFDRFSEHLSGYGERIAVIIDQFFFSDFTERLARQFEGTGRSVRTYKFDSEVSDTEINGKIEQLTPFRPDVVAGIGGGKTIDVAKAVSNEMRIPVVIVPTSASTDAPTSALSIIYTDAGEHCRKQCYDQSPSLVLVDSKIIAQAPIRFLIAGMGDALSTAFEASANAASDSHNSFCQKTGLYRRTRTSVAVARECYRTLLEDGERAILAARNHAVTEALENIIEANTLMSGIGFENTGVAAAHAVASGITHLPESRGLLHGELVCFGLLCQLAAENAPSETVDEVYRFACKVGLPVCLSDLNMEATPDRIRRIAMASMNYAWHAEPFAYTEETIAGAITVADALGKSYKEKTSLHCD